MNSERLLQFILLVLISFGNSEMGARKIKNSFKIEKEQKHEVEKDAEIQGVNICLIDSIQNGTENYKEEQKALRECMYAGYDKEVNSNIESFILVNPSGNTITGFNVKIDYLDMQGRLLHSREVNQPCSIPSGESRRIDIISWDRQHTYYYYLGNQPKRVATPFKVHFHPISFWIDK